MGPQNLPRPRSARLLPNRGTGGRVSGLFPTPAPPPRLSEGTMDGTSAGSRTRIGVSYQHKTGRAADVSSQAAGGDADACASLCSKRQGYVGCNPVTSPIMAQQQTPVSVNSAVSQLSWWKSNKSRKISTRSRVTGLACALLYSSLPAGRSRERKRAAPRRRQVLSDPCLGVREICCPARPSRQSARGPPGG